MILFLLILCVFFSFSTFYVFVMHFVYDLNNNNCTVLLTVDYCMFDVERCAGLLLVVTVMLWVASVSSAEGTCRCASCGAAICRAACRTDCNKCCRCCIYFEMRVGRRATSSTSSRQLRDPDLLDVSGGLPADRRSRLVRVKRHFQLFQHR